MERNSPLTPNSSFGMEAPRQRCRMQQEPGRREWSQLWAARLALIAITVIGYACQSAACCCNQVVSKSIGPPESEATPTHMTLDHALWSDDSRVHPGVESVFEDKPLAILAHVAEWYGFPRMRAFTATADKQFSLQAPGYPSIEAFSGTGGITSSDGRLRYVILHLRNPSDVDRSATYKLIPRNDVAGFQWLGECQVAAPSGSSE